MPDDQQPSPAGWLDPNQREQASQALSAIATHAWRAQSRMRSAAEGREDFKRIARSVEGIVDNLVSLGIVIKDHTGEAFDYGLPLKIVTTQPTPGLAREQIIETLKPTVYWNQRIIQQGEVVVATPAPTKSNESNNH